MLERRLAMLEEALRQERARNKVHPETAYNPSSLVGGLRHRQGLVTKTSTLFLRYPCRMAYSVKRCMNLALKLLNPRF